MSENPTTFPKIGQNWLFELFVKGRPSIPMSMLKTFPTTLSEFFFQETSYGV